MKRTTSALLAVALAAGLGATILASRTPARANAFSGPFAGGTSGGAAASCGETDTCGALGYVATRTDGEAAFTATGAGPALKGPCANCTVEFTGSGETNLCPSGSTNCVVQIGVAHRFVGQDYYNTNGAVHLNNNAKLTNDTRHINLDGLRGINATLVTALPTCDASLNLDGDLAPGVTWLYYRSTGAADRRCECLRQADGSTYAWVSSAGTGTSTSCP